MSVERDGEIVRLTGECHVEDAEALASLLETSDIRAVDIGDCRRLHSAVLQALLCYRPAIIGAPHDDFLRGWVFPNFDPEAKEEARGEDA